MATTLENTPADNADGAHHGFAQLLSLDAWKTEWTSHYDRHSDTLFLRRQGHRASVSYFLPDLEEFVLRLDAETGELSGMDLVDFKSYFCAQIPPLRVVYERFFSRRAQLLQRLFPKTPAADTVVVDEARASAQRLCPA